MREAVVQTALDLEEVLGGLEEVDVSLIERLERLLCVPTGGASEDGRHPDGHRAGAEKRGEHLSAHDECLLVTSRDELDDEGEGE